MIEKEIEKNNALRALIKNSKPDLLLMVQELKEEGKPLSFDETATKEILVNYIFQRTEYIRKIKEKNERLESFSNSPFVPNLPDPVHDSIPDPKPPEDIELAGKTDIEKTKAYLARQQKLSMHIPLEEGEKEGAFQTVTINGYRLIIKKGVFVELPLPVAQLLAENMKIQLNPEQNELNKSFNINRNAETQKALS